MKLKQRPEDFSVKESYRFDPVEDGKYRVYMMDKQKLSTFDAITRLQEKFGLRPGAISYCGLKDKQGRTEQLIAVEGKDIDMQEEDLRLKLLGRTDRPLSAKNTTSNRFAVTVRDVGAIDVPRLTISAAEVSRLGVVNYFDSQRFGSLKHGQGFIAKDLIRGDFEAALRNYLARPSELDRSDDAKVKQFWKENWGDWNERCPWPANKKYFRVLQQLRKDPKDYVSAFLQIDSAYRAMLLFTYQSFLWNEGVRRLLQITMPREHLFPVPYQAGTLLFHRDSAPAHLEWMRHATFPLLAPNSTFKDARIEEAMSWVLGREKLTLEELRIEEAPRLLYFKHEERPLLVTPQKLVLSKAKPDPMNKGRLQVNIAFTLPPGSYATLVVKRLFHFAWTKEHERYEPRPWATEVQDDERDDERDEEREDRRAPSPHPERTRRVPPSAPAQRARAAPSAPPKPADDRPSAPSQGFLARQRDRKAAKKANRAAFGKA